jgi:thiamine-phosphate pyrophosphorylase
MIALPAKLYAIVGPDARGRRPVELAEGMLAGGARILQLRWKDAAAGELVEAARAIRKLARRHGAWLLVNDRADVALAADADGVHLGQDDLPLAAARRLLGRRVIGVSTHDVAQARAAAAGGADYVGFGPVFGTTTKETGYAPRGLEGLREIRRAVGVPIVAIGGIDERRARGVLEAGADAVAMISALAAEDVAAAVRRIAALLDSARPLH